MARGTTWRSQPPDRREAFPPAGVELAAEELPGAVLVLKARGEIDLSVHEQFRSALCGAIAGNHEHVVVDLEGCFVDLGGISALAEAAAAANSLGRRLSLVSTSKLLSKVLDIACPQLRELCHASTGEALRRD